MEILKTIPINLDLKRVTAQAATIPPLVVGDNGNVFEITLTDGGLPVDLSDCRVLAVFSTPEGVTVEQDTDGNGVTIGGDAHNVVTIDVRTGSFSDGKNNCELQIYSGAEYGTLVTTAQFNFDGRRSIMNEETLLADDKYPVLVGLLRDAEQALQNSQTAFAEANEASDRADEAASSANTAADRANSSASFADQAAERAETATETASGAAMNASSASTAASTAAVRANTAADRATTAAERAEAAAGASGDMNTIVYDADKDGVVDDAERLGGQLPSYYATAASIEAITPVSIGAVWGKKATAELIASGWSKNAQVITVQGVTAANDILVACEPSDASALEAWNKAGVVASAQTTNAVTFSCTKVPTVNLTANIMILEGVRE